ncbi:KIR protein [Plasmodium coatneyi]|uniref:KIR protein n=1 Tax=Plasmodium coatneyi TaxID=208452 RepID=A0A1B1E5Z7_9APIC|nr:KIR protein [Plasmodium coatneyi]ANQ10413.1 KIR protein [Plasmodium coatneyi]
MSPEPSKPAQPELTEDDLKGLLSKKTYAAFDQGYNGYNGCNTNGIDPNNTITKLKDALTDHPHLQSEVEKIVKAWCSAFQAGSGSSTPYAGRCEYFYYWLWDLLKNKLKVPSPLDIMKKIYGAFESVSSSPTTAERKEGCKNVNDKISDEEFFPQVKIHFDFSKDYQTLQSQLRNGGSGGGTKTCDTTYHKHLQAITKACEAIAADCGERGPQKSGSYCGPLQAAGSTEGAAGPYCTKEELQKLQCQEVTEPQTTLQATDFQVNHVSSMGGGEGGSAVGAGPIVSSTIGTLIGIPAIAALLYKVNLKKKRKEKEEKKIFFLNIYI